MAKNKNVNVDEMENHALQPGVEIGAPDTTAAVETAELIKNNPAFVVDKNWSIGAKLAGRYLGTSRVYSEKFTAGKVETAEGPNKGKKFRDLHNLVDTKGNEFGIWSVGTLGELFSRLPRNAYVVLTYTGRAEEALKPGQTPPYTFDIQIEKGVRLAPRSGNDGDQIPPPAAAVAGGGVAANMN